MSLTGTMDDDFYTDTEVVDLITRQKELNFAPGDDQSQQSCKTGGRYLPG